MTDVRLYLFGVPRIEYQGAPVKIERRKGLALAAYLAVNSQSQNRDEIAGLLWPDQDVDHARSTLRSTLRALSMPLPVKWIDADRTTLALKNEVVWVDVNAFTTLLSQNGAHKHGHDRICDECVGRYEQAIELYRADFLKGFHLPVSIEYEDWQLSQQEWLRREYADVLRRMSNFYAEKQQYDEALKYARQWLSIDSIHEPAHRLLMRLYVASGQRSEAIRQYKLCVQVLDAELATPPENETKLLYEAILNEKSFQETMGGSDRLTTSGIMPPLPALVVGREETLKAIKDRLGIGGSEMRAVTVVQGWPGVGKSTTVAMLAHDPEVARHFPDGVLWVSLGENPDIAGGITAWAEALKISEPGRVRKIEEISAQITAVLRELRVLLIVDDVWLSEHAAPFRVGGQSCSLIMTSRLNDVSTSLAPTAGDVYRLPVLTESAGLELFAKLTPETAAQYPEETTKLVNDLEGLPLAIHVAGRLLHNEARLGWGVSELLMELRAGANLLMAKLPSDMIAARDENASPTVAALLKRSTDVLAPEVRSRFALLSFFAPKPASFDLAAMRAVWDVSDPRPFARKLVDRGLLEPVSGGRFQMHALLVLHARSLLEIEFGGLT